jgi:hypothetical protein
MCVAAAALHVRRSINVISRHQILIAWSDDKALAPDDLSAGSSQVTGSRFLQSVRLTLFSCSGRLRLLHRADVL